MDKINALIEVPVMELLEISNECAKIIGKVTTIIKDKHFTIPQKEASSEEKPVVSAEPKKEDSLEKEILPGIVVKKHPTKPFEMVIE